MSHNNDQRTFLAAELPLIARIMDENAVSRAQWLLGTGIKPSEIDEGIELLSQEQLDIIFRNIFRLSIREDIGIQLGLAMNVSRWGVFGLTMLCAKTLSDALLTTQQIFPIAHARFELKGEIVARSVVMSFVRESLFPFPVSQEFVYEFVFSVVARHISDILGEPFKFTCLKLPYPKPAYHRLYEKVALNVEFNCDVAGGWFPEELLEKPPRLSNPTAYQQALKMCHEELDRLEAQRKGDIGILIKYELAKQPYDIPTLDELAGRLALSPRTLRRRLTDAGTNYREIIQTHQQEIALRELSEKRYSLTRIAEHCGFKDPKSFREAFKRWTNMTPSEYQKQFPQ